MFYLGDPDLAIGRIRSSRKWRLQRCVRNDLLVTFALPSLLFRSFLSIFCSSLRSRLNKILVTHHFRFPKDERLRRTANFGLVIGLEQGLDTFLLKNAPGDGCLSALGKLLEVSLNALLSRVVQCVCISL
jgi:hypothetical protein